jgi:HEPN domain-containing protein
MKNQHSVPISTAKKWLSYAEEDLSVAKRELNAERPSYHTICFLCQSAAEKYLKGYLILKGWRLKRAHDLVVLLRECSEYGSQLSDLLEEGAVLNEYAVTGRYPGDLAFDTIGEAEASEAVQAVEHIADRVRELFIPQE